MKIIDEEELETRVRAIFGRTSSSIDATAKASVEHYLDHGEFEMALEGLCIELFNSGTLSRTDAAELIELATAMDLEREAAFDVQIVAKLKAI